MTSPRRLRWTPALAAPCLAGLLALAGCGEDSPAPGGSEPPSASSSPGATTEGDGGSAETGEEQTCAGVGQAALVRATGTAQRLQTPTGGGDAVRCETGVDERGMRTEWEVRPVIGDLDTEGENADLPDLQRTRIEVGEGGTAVPGWQLTGEVAGNRTATVITVLPGERTVVVSASDDGDSTATVTDPQLLEAALGIAEEIVRTDAGAAGAGDQGDPS